MSRAALLLLAMLAGCGERAPTRIDGTSPESFEATTSAARRDLSAVDRLTFDRALGSVGGRRFGNRDQDALARVSFDGMTARQVVADQHSRER
jgi:hypothetical protein